MDLMQQMGDVNENNVTIDEVDAALNLTSIGDSRRQPSEPRYALRPRVARGPAS